MAREGCFSGSLCDRRREPFCRTLLVLTRVLMLILIFIIILIVGKAGWACGAPRQDGRRMFDWSMLAKSSGYFKALLLADDLRRRGFRRIAPGMPDG